MDAVRMNCPSGANDTTILLDTPQTISYFASMPSLRHRLFALLCLLALPAAAQKFSVKSITFTGYPAASQSELLQASGLKGPGEITQAEFQAAAMKLNDTGIFAHIAYKFDGQAFSFVLEPAPGLVPARFDNFAWMNVIDIDTQLRAKVPLYKGKVIAGSGLEQQVIAALTVMAAEQHLDATVTVLPVYPPDSKQLAAEEFRVTSPPVTVSQLTVEGASPAFSDKLAPVVKAAVGEDFSLSITPDELSTAITNVYRNEGFLDVQVTAVRNETPTITPDKVSVPVKAVVVEGGQYRLGKLTLDGTVLMSQEEFQKRAFLKPGDIANQELLRKTLLIAGAPYRSKGYLRARIGATPTLDASTHTVDYVVHVAPGEQWRMGKLDVLNLTDAQRVKFLSVWSMKPGDVYDVGYPSSFLVKNKTALQELAGYSAGYKQYEHEDTHIVDLVVSFQHGGPLQ